MTTNKWFKYILDNREIFYACSNHYIGYWYYISQHPNITLDDVKSHPECPWDWEMVSKNPNITWKDILENLELPWNYEILSSHPELDFEFVKANPEKVWSFVHISRNANITWDIVKANKYWNHPDKKKRAIPWSFRALSMNPNITMDIIKANLTMNWSYEPLLDNPNITWECINLLIQSRPHILVKSVENNSYWRRLSRHRIITMDIVKAHPEYPWNIRSLTTNPNITMDIVEGNPTYKWCRYSLSENQNITMDFVKSNRTKYIWDIRSLVNNPSISWKDILENPEIFTFRVFKHYKDVRNEIEITWEDVLNTEDVKEKSAFKDCFKCHNPNMNWDIIELERQANEKTKTNQIQSDKDIQYKNENLYMSAVSNPMSEPVKKRQQARCALLKEEILAAVFHPSRVTKWAEQYGLGNMRESMYMY